MSTGKRAYDLLRGYVNREYDRIRGVDLDNAQQELNDVLDGKMPASSVTSSERTDTAPTMPPGFSREERACKILGVEPKCSFEEIRKSFERLNKRSEPSNFPAGSQERDQAAQIQKHVQWAYGVLSESVDTVEKRFRSLEID